MSNKELLAQLVAQNEQILKNLDSLNQRVTTLEKGKTSKTSTKKSESKSKKSESEKKTQTYEEHLTEAFGDKETRKKFVELKKKVADYCKELAEELEVYIPKKSYNKFLNQTTESLNGKFDKKVVKKAFVSNAK